MNIYEEIMTPFVHESGHAMVAWYSPVVKRVKGVWAASAEEMKANPKIEIDGMRMLGEVNYCVSPECLNEPKKQWDLIAVILGGIAAQILIFKVFQSRPCFVDFGFAKHRAEILLTKCAPDSCPWTEDKTAPHLDFTKIFVSPPSQAARKVLNLSLNRAWSLIKNNRQTFDRLVLALKNRKKLNTADLREILGFRLRACCLNPNAEM